MLPALGGEGLDICLSRTVGPWSDVLSFAA